MCLSSPLVQQNVWNVLECQLWTRAQHLLLTGESGPVQKISLFVYKPLKKKVCIFTDALTHIPKKKKKINKQKPTRVGL